MRKTSAAFLIMAIASLPLAACGDDDDDGGLGGSDGGSEASFCDDARDLEEEFAGIESDDFDPENFAALRDSLADLNPPSEIEDDYNTMIEGLDLFLEIFEDIDLSDPAALEQLGEIEDDLAEFEAASERVGEFMEQECGIEAD